MVTYQYSGPNLRGIKKAMRKVLDATLANHRKRFMPRHFTQGAYARYPAEYQKIGAGIQAQRAHRAAAIRLRFDATPPEQWGQLRAEIQSEMDRRRVNPNRLLPLVDTGLMREMVLIGHATFQGSLNARRMMLTVPFYISSTTGIATKRAALEVVRSDEGRVFAKFADRKIQQFANTKTLRR